MSNALLSECCHVPFKGFLRSAFYVTLENNLPNSIASFVSTSLSPLALKNHFFLITGDPKGIQRPTGGHIVALSWVMKNIYAMKGGENWYLLLLHFWNESFIQYNVWDFRWAASDLGWVVGHSFICYGPLLAGLSTLIYEGKPVGTPDAGQFFRVIQDHKIQGLSTAPTALRAIRREDPELEYGRKYDTSS